MFLAEKPTRWEDPGIAMLKIINIERGDGLGNRRAHALANRLKWKRNQRMQAFATVCGLGCAVARDLLAITNEWFG
jgi:hypothetical protein